MSKEKTRDEALREIWEHDLLGRREEADTIQSFLEHESATYLEKNREKSLVLAIDAHYGEGKTWFLERLAEQLALSHPVARIDAWADDASEEPLTAFMVSIEDALDPYLSKSKKLRDKLAYAKVAALPVMGRLVKGVMVKGLSKVAGEGADEALGNVFEGAINDARKRNDDSQKDGAAAAAVEGAFEDLGKEIDNLVDRRGAAMLAEYRQRKKSREGFRQNMRELVAAIDASDVSGNTPLIVVVDELDRCRPDYAIRMLEEIKHFFEVPGVVFILAIHKDQLQASIEAVYGSKFSADQYLRRFFDRRWELRRLTTHEIVATEWSSWPSMKEKFEGAEALINDKVVALGGPSLISQFFDAHSVSARETVAVMDALRLFGQSWTFPIRASLLMLVPMAINLIRQRPVAALHDLPAYPFSLPSTVPIDHFSRKMKSASTNNAIREIFFMKSRPLSAIQNIDLTSDPDYNFSLLFFEKEMRERKAAGEKTVEHGWSLVSSYAEKLERIEGLVQQIPEQLG